MKALSLPGLAAPEPPWTIQALQARCRANAELARNDPDRRRLTVSIEMRTAAQLEAQRKQRG